MLTETWVDNKVLDLINTHFIFCKPLSLRPFPPACLCLTAVPRQGVRPRGRRKTTCRSTRRPVMTRLLTPVKSGMSASEMRRAASPHRRLRKADR